jgi:hypothetical protein
MPEPSDDDDPPKPGPWRPRRSVAVIALIVIGVLALAGGATGLTQELTRHATPTEAQAAATAEVASRWQRLPAGQIFPSQLSYTDTAGSSVRLTRVGIARPAACVHAADPVLVQVLLQAGCVTVLRASYVDQTSTLVATVGIAVFRSGTAAARAAGDIRDGDSAGLDALTVPGTAASGFGNAQRETSAHAYPGQGPYVFFVTGGFTDGRPRTSGTPDPVLIDLVSDVPAELVPILVRTGNACREKDVRC